LGEIKSTTENLGTAVSGEVFEFNTMYPEYLTKAKNEGNQQAAWSFDVANKVEQIHANLFSKAIETLKTRKKTASVDYFVCSVCGNTVEDDAPERCPICGAPKTKFLRIA
jgi:rubrerythrin